MASQSFAFPRLPMPDGVSIRQHLPREQIDDPESDVTRKLLAAGLGARVPSGGRVAITAGSRGMGGFVPLLRGIIEAVKQAGGQPFLVPAMGSHGGATAEGQTDILRGLGVTQETV